jgi:NADPH-dependent 2,4-dienoyl-CoA reductase/sulfur reductase-like enzyme
VNRYLILGNGAAGATAAEAIRQHDAAGEITLVSGEKYPMYSRPGLAYVVIDEIPAQQVIARTPAWYEQLRLKLLYGTATRLDTAARRVHLADGRSLAFDRLLIATGARAVGLPYPGKDLDGIVYLDTLDGTKDLLKRVRRARRAVVVGGGITALEMAEGFAHHGLETHYFVRKDRLWSVVFNQTESDLLAERMAKHGVKVHYNTEVAEVLGDRHGRVTSVRTTKGATLPCDLLGAGIGVKPQLDVARGTPLKIDNGLLVDELLETNVPGIFAAGDCAQIWDRWTESHTLDVLWPTAIAAGRAAGANMAGHTVPYVRGTPFNACLLFGLHVTAMGQLGNKRDADEPEVYQHLSRGSSEVWAARPHAYTSAWAQVGVNTVRLSLNHNQLVGALVVGNQRLADPLRDLIDGQVDCTPLRPYLVEGGPALADMIVKYWIFLKGRRPAGLVERLTPALPAVPDKG